MDALLALAAMGLRPQGPKIPRGFVWIAQPKARKRGRARWNYRR
jgi:hypothetical protein